MGFGSIVGSDYLYHMPPRNRLLILIYIILYILMYIYVKV